MRSRRLFCIAFLPLLLSLYLQPLQAQEIGNFGVPEAIPHTLSNADARRVADVLFGTSEIAPCLPPAELSDGTLSGTLCAGEIPYCFCADSAVIDVWVYGLYSPSAPDAYYGALCRTSPPTEAQIAVAQEHAGKLLDEMALGQWLPGPACVETQLRGNTPGYAISVTALPADDGAEDALAVFRFSANGTLLSFTIHI